MPRPRALQIVLWSAVTSLATGLALHQSGSFQLGTYEDDASYVVLARSLIEANAYGLMNEPDRPAPARYPFGYPLLLSPIIWLFPDDPAAGRWLSLLATLATGACLFWLWPSFSQTRSFWWGLAVSALILSPMTIAHTNMIMSEPAFTLCLVVLIVLTEQAARGQEWRGWTIVAGLVVVETIFTRTIGLVAVITCGAYLVWIRGRAGLTSVARAAAAALVVLSVIVVATPVARGDLIPLEYLAQIVDPVAYRPRQSSGPLASRLLKSTYAHATINLRQVTLPFGGGESEQAIIARIGVPGLPIALNLGVAALVAVGWGLWIARAGPSAGALAGLAYLLTIPVFPWPRVRYLYPVLPQIFFALLLAIAFFSRLVFSRWPRRSTLAERWMPAIATVFLLGASVYKDTLRDDSRVHVGDLELRSQWIRTHTHPEAIVMTEQGQTDFLYGRRRTVPYPPQSEKPALWNYLRDRRVDYILLGPNLVWQSQYAPVPSRSTRRVVAEIAPLIADGRLVEVHTSQDGSVRVLAVRRDEENR